MRPAPAASLISACATRSALGARRCAPRALLACVPGGAAAGCHRRHALRARRRLGLGLGLGFGLGFGFGFGFGLGLGLGLGLRVGLGGDGARLPRPSAVAVAGGDEPEVCERYMDAKFGGEDADRPTWRGS